MKKAFTLIEILIVVSIIALIAAIGIPFRRL
jgi:prepilin-type N-terminal cleavage/methylation domain-containing protein